MSALVGAFSKLRIGGSRGATEESSQPAPSRATVNACGRQYTVRYMSREEYAELGDKINRLAVAQQNIAAADRVIAQADARIAQADARIAQADARIAQADARITQADAKIAQADAKMTQADAQIALGTAQVVEAEAAIKTLNAQMIQTLTILEGKLAQMRPRFENDPVKLQKFCAITEQVAQFKSRVGAYSEVEQKQMMQQFAVEFQALLKA